MNAPPDQFEDRNIIIRPFIQEDSQAIYSYLSQSFVCGDLLLPYSKESTHFSRLLAEKDPGQHRFVACSDRGVHGLVILTQRLRPRLQHSGTITMLVDSGYQPAAVTKALITAAIEMAERWLNLSRIQAEVAVSNELLLKILKFNGFQVEGQRRMARLVDGVSGDNLVLARIRPGFHPLVTEVDPAFLISALDRSSAKRSFDVLEIRPVRVEDAQAFHEMLKDPAIDRTTLQLPSIEMREVEDRLENSAPWLHRFAAIADNRVVGSISLVQKNTPGSTHIGHIGMKVHRDYWGMGIGTKLVEKITNLADNSLDIYRLELDVSADNPSAIHIYKKCGFSIEGTKKYHTYGDGRWADSYFMARFRD